MTDFAAPDTSIPRPRPDQLLVLAAMDPRQVAAVLSAVLVGRYVRVERPKTERERLLLAEFGSPPNAPVGGEGLVTDVRVDEGARVWVDWDWGMSQDVTGLEWHTFTVLDVDGRGEPVDGRRHRT